MKNYLAEFIGTFFWVLTAGMVIASGDPLGGLAVGSVLMAMVYAGGHLSGAHYNPAVSLGAWLAGRLEMAEALKYMLVQLVAGLVAAFACLHLLDGDTVVVEPGAAAVPAVLAEFLFTFALTWVALNVAASGEKSGWATSGLAIGFTVAAGIYAVGALSGGAFNPAVALGPIVVDALMGDGSFGNVWLYLLGPLAGGAVAAVVVRVQGG